MIMSGLAARKPSTSDDMSGVEISTSILLTVVALEDLDPTAVDAAPVVDGCGRGLHGTHAGDDEVVTGHHAFHGDHAATDFGVAHAHIGRPTVPGPRSRSRRSVHGARRRSD